MPCSKTSRKLWKNENTRALPPSGLRNSSLWESRCFVRCSNAHGALLNHNCGYKPFVEGTQPVHDNHCFLTSHMAFKTADPMDLAVLHWTWKVAGLSRRPFHVRLETLKVPAGIQGPVRGLARSPSSTGSGAGGTAGRRLRRSRPNSFSRADGWPFYRHVAGVRIATGNGAASCCIECKNLFDL